MKIFTKMFLAACMITGFAFSVNAQSVGINSTGDAPNGSAMLDVSSTTKGFLPPRMNLDQILLIQAPAEGLIVYNTNSKCLVYYDGTNWRKMDNSLLDFGFAIGQNRLGGVIFYIDETGQHGLISATSDQSTGAQWGCYGTALGSTSTAVGTGQSNTTAILSGCSDLGISARICDDLVLNGYSDWFLPSLDELNLMYLQQTAIGGFVSTWYTSSSEKSPEISVFVWLQNPITGQQVWGHKYGEPYVRAIRAF